MSEPTPVADHVRRSRDLRLRREYGLSLEEWEALLAEQGGGCAGCGRVGVTRALHTDHDHKELFTRGLLCVHCNGALKKAADNPLTLLNLAKYLQDPPAVRLYGKRAARNRKRSRRRRAVKRKRAQRPARAAAKKARKK